MPRQTTTFQRWAGQEEDPRPTPLDDGDWWFSPQRRLGDVARAGAAAALAVSVGIASGFNRNDESVPRPAPAEQDTGAKLEARPTPAFLKVWGDQDEIAAPPAVTTGGGGFTYGLRAKADPRFQRWPHTDELPTSPLPLGYGEDEAPVLARSIDTAAATVWASDEDIPAQSAPLPVDELYWLRPEPLKVAPTLRVWLSEDEQPTPGAITFVEDDTWWAVVQTPAPVPRRALYLPDADDAAVTPSAPAFACDDSYWLTWPVTPAPARMGYAIADGDDTPELFVPVVVVPTTEGPWRIGPRTERDIRERIGRKVQRTRLRTNG